MPWLNNIKICQAKIDQGCDALENLIYEKKSNVVSQGKLLQRNFKKEDAVIMKIKHTNYYDVVEKKISQDTVSYIVQFIHNEEAIFSQQRADFN